MAAITLLPRQTAPLPWAQRLGYLLDLVGAADKAVSLRAYVRNKARDGTFLLPAGPRRKAMRSADWKLYVNAEVEPEA